MGGTQRMAERAGAARAREFVMTGGLFTAGATCATGVWLIGAASREELLEKARASPAAWPRA